MTLHADRFRRGFTLVELLVVISIVAVLSALSIPSMLRMGGFSSDDTAVGAREMFQMLRSARMYATTNNVETALVYQARFVYETANDDAVDAGDIVPIVVGYLLCRRATDDEIAYINDNLLDAGSPLDADDPYFVPVDGTSQGFREMPGESCLLPDVFEVEAGGGASQTGLSQVYLLDPAELFADPASVGETGFLEPLRHIWDNTEPLHYEQETAVPPTLTLIDTTNADIFAFPAHRFSPSGEMLPIQDVQRFRIRVGLRPDSLVRDRYVTHDIDVNGIDLDYAEHRDLVGDPTGGTPLAPTFPTDTEPVTIQFHRTDVTTPAAQVDPEIIPRFHDPRREDRASIAGFDAFIEDTSDLLVYTATGRVKIDPET